MRAFLFLVSAATALGVAHADCGVKGTAGTKALCEMLAFHYGEEFLESSTSSHPPGCSKYSGGGSTWIVWSDWSNSPVTTAGSASHEDVCLCGTDATWNSDSTTCTCPLTDKSFLTTDSRCVYDNCDTARKAECTADNKEDCSPGKNTVANVGGSFVVVPVPCGGCKAGFYDKNGEGTCVAQQACSAASATCTGGAIKDGSSTCATDTCDSADFGDSTKACCKVDVCDADAQAVCAAANKEGCSSGSTNCGGCATGYKDGVTGTCVDVCDDDAQLVCTTANKEGCSSGSTNCGGCATGYKDGVTGTCVDVCDDDAQLVCTTANKEVCTIGSGSTDCGPCLSGYKDDGTGTGTCVDADAKLLADLASCHSTALSDLQEKVACEFN